MNDTLSSVRADYGPHVTAKLLSKYWLILVILLLTLVFTVLRPQLLDPSNIASILRSSSITAIMVFGVTWVFAAGKIDISFMNVAALANMLTAYLISGGWSWPAAMIVAIGVGSLVGVVNGVLIGISRLPALIVTIATGGMCLSAAASIGKGAPLRIADTGPFGAFLEFNIGPVPVFVLAVILLYSVGWYLQERLTFGHYIYALEQNEEAVLEAGIANKRLVFLIYVVAAGFAALAGVLLTASLSTGHPNVGSSYFMDGLTAVLLGAMAIRLGKPNVLGTATAIILLVVLVSGSALLGWPDYQRQIIKGLLLLFGVGIAVYFATRRP